MTALVDVRDLRISYRDDAAPAVDGVSFSVAPGEVVALVGESGSGKSTIARSLLGLVAPTASVTASRMEIDGADALAFGPRDWRGIRGRFAGLVLQDALVSLDPLRTVRREVGEAVREAGGVRGRAAVRTRVLELLDAVGMDDSRRRARQHAHELSGGLRQRALIATAIAGDPRLLIADEPTTALDVAVQRQVIDLLRRQRDKGLGILLVSHDLGMVAEIADRILVLGGGVELESGSAAEVLGTPQHEATRRLVAAIPRISSTPATPAERVETAPVLEIRDVSVRYRVRGEKGPEDLVALDDVSVVVNRGRTLGVVGESGSGKSTLLQVLLGLQPVDEGRILLDGEDWGGITERERRPQRRRIQIVAQDPLSSFDPRYRVRDVLAEPLRHLTAAERDVRIAELLADVGLSPDLTDRRPLHLSGGQRQRVAIARALAADPEVLLCDEAVSALDVLVQEQILDLLARIGRERELTIVFVSHDLAVVHRVSDDIIVLQRGVVVESGPADAVYRDPQHPYTRSLFAHLPDGAAE